MSRGPRWLVPALFALIALAAIFGVGLALQWGVPVPVVRDSADPDGAGIGMDLSPWIWTGYVLIATAVLGAVLVYAQIRTKKVTPAERQSGEAGARQIYAEEEEKRSEP